MPRPQYGLPFKQLPQRALTPESMLDEEKRTGQQRIQSKYALQWKTAVQSKRFIGQGKVQRMLRDIDARAKQEMLQFNQQMQQQTIQLQNVNRLAQQGAINNPEQIKARMTFGPDVAKSMYPTPEKEKPPMQQFADLDIYSHRISDELEWFKEGKPKFPGYTKLLGPTGAGTIAAYYMGRAKKRNVRIWDPDTEDYTIKATPEKIAEYDMWLQEERNVAKLKRELTGQLGIGRKQVQPGAKGGTFSDKIAESVRPRQTPTVTKPKVIRQRNTRTGQTRVSYDGGKTWQIVSG